jgi:hypothetical protein
MSKIVPKPAPRKGAADSVFESTINDFAIVTGSKAAAIPLVRESLAGESWERLVEQQTLFRVFGDRRPPPWRYVGDELRVGYVQLALHRWVPAYLGDLRAYVGKAYRKNGRAVIEPTAVYAWDLNLRDEVELEARNSRGGPIAHLRRRLRKGLRAVGDIPFLFVAELTGAGRLHLHGSLACMPKQQIQVKRVLCRVGGHTGQSSAMKALMLEFKLLETELDGLRKASYSAKNIQTAAQVLGHRAWATRTDVLRQAQQIHDLHRRFLLNGATVVAPEASPQLQVTPVINGVETRPAAGGSSGIAPRTQLAP